MLMAIWVVASFSALTSSAAKEHVWSLLSARVYRVKLLQGAGCVFGLLGVPNWPSKFAHPEMF